MSSDDLELLIMQLIVNSGSARSLALEAVQSAKSARWTEADAKLAECDEALGLAHEIQTKLLQREAQGNEYKSSLLLTHSQDHLMNAITVSDLSKQMVELWHFIHNK